MSSTWTMIATSHAQIPSKPQTDKIVKSEVTTGFNGCKMELDGLESSSVPTNLDNMYTVQVHTVISVYTLRLQTVRSPLKFEEASR